MKVLKLVLIIVAIFGATVLLAQAPDTLWTKLYGSNLWFPDWMPFNMMQPTFDGGFVILANQGTNGEPHIIKTDSAGNIEWVSEPAEGWQSTSTAIYQTADSGFIFTGSKAFGAWDINIFLYKLAPNGDSMWLKFYDAGGNFDEYSRWVEQTSDGGYIVVGGKMTSVQDYNLYLLKTDTIGNVVWTNEFGGAGRDDGICVRQTADGGYMVGGTTSSYGAGMSDNWLLRTDANGDTLWSRTYGIQTYDNLWEIEPTADGGYALVGSNYLYGSQVFRVDSVGNVIWHQFVGVQNGFGSVARTVWGGFVMMETDIANLVLTKFDDMGDTLWTRDYTGPNWGRARVIQPTSDSCFAIAGTKGSDAFLMKVRDWYYISGYTKYYANQNPVESVKVCVGGYEVDTVLTDPAGRYVKLYLPMLKDYTITPYKINSTQQNAISSYDAALILQHAVGIITLDSLQRIAADVSGNGNISSFDGGVILQYAVGIRHHFPVGARPGLDTVDWTFRPPSRIYDSLKTVLRNQNFQAILYGDPSGNWTPTDEHQSPITSNFFVWGGNLPNEEDKITTDKSNPSSLQAINVELDKHGFSTVIETMKTTKFSTFPIKISNAKDVISADIVLTYNSDEITIKEVTLGNSTADYLYAWTTSGNTIRIALAGAKPLNGNVELAKVSYTTEREEKFEIQNSKLKILSIVLNEGKESATNKTLEGAAGYKTELPSHFYLASPKPNPFSKGTRISYGLPIESKVKIAVFDATGQSVRTLIETSQPAGYYFTDWNGKDNQNYKLANGIYFIRMQIETNKFLRKVVLLKQ